MHQYHRIKVRLQNESVIHKTRTLLWVYRIVRLKHTTVDRTFTFHNHHNLLCLTQYDNTHFLQSHIRRWSVDEYKVQRTQSVAMIMPRNSLKILIAITISTNTIIPSNVLDKRANTCQAQIVLLCLPHSPKHI